MSDCMHFSDTVEEFMEQYKMTDTKQVYSNGTEYVPIFRMEQWFEHEKAQHSQEGTTFDLISKFIDGLEEIFADLRERHVDDSVCGLCEYDGAYIGQSGNWCNECPGFDRDDCFKLSDKTRKEWTEEIIKALPSIQPEQCGDKSYTLWKESYEELKRRMDELTSCSDIISRQAAIDALAEQMPTPYTPDGSHPADEQIFQVQEVYADCITTIKLLQPVQPEPKEGHWIRTDCGLDVECKCSVCGYKDFVEPHDTYWFKRNYCPNYGVRMKGERQK